MKTRCPNCGTCVSLDALVAHEDAREALQLVFQLSGALGSAVTRYIGLFRPEKRELTLERVAKLLGEIVPAIRAEQIERNGQTYPAPAEAWAWAINQMLSARDAGRLKLPLTKHSYLFEVLAGWQPTAAVTALPALSGHTPASPPAPSRTLSAIGALESRIRD